MDNRIEYPQISIITCTYNGGRVIEEYFKNLFSQNYPKDKIELIISEGGSTDKTNEIIQKYKKKFPKVIKLFKNKARFKVGRGGGVDTASKKANGEFIVLIDQDNLLTQKNWLKKMIEILMKNKDISGVQSRLEAPEKSTLVDKYLNSIGIEDPFVINYSLNSQITFNPRNFEYNTDGEFYIYEINENNFYYAGDNGFIIRKKDFFESGGYTQDIDNFYRMALSKRGYKIAVPKKIKLHHKSSTNIKHLINKKAFYIRHYLLKNYSNRDFYWFNSRKNNIKQNLRFIKTIFFNFLFFPEFIRGIKMMIREKRVFWIIHPVLIWIITINYFFSSFMVIIFKKQKSAEI